MSPVRNTLIIASLTLSFSVVDLPITQAGDRNSSWGWAKPMNQRQGLFYTSNQAFKRGGSSRQTSAWTPYRSPRTVQPSRRTVQPSYFFRGRPGLIPFNQVGRPLRFGLGFRDLPPSRP